jgi:hypothetical protein
MGSVLLEIVAIGLHHDGARNHVFGPTGSNPERLPVHGSPIEPRIPHPVPRLLGIRTDEGRRSTGGAFCEVRMSDTEEVPGTDPLGIGADRVVATKGPFFMRGSNR